MADPVQNLTFVSWIRERVSGLATGPAGGRAQAAATVTLTARESNGSVVGIRDALAVVSARRTGGRCRPWSRRDREAIPVARHARS